MIPRWTFQRMLGGDLPSNPVFELDNRSKRGIALDLTVPDGLEVALELIDRADVFVTNIRASALARLGLDPASLLARNERLVYALITGYGLGGPDADRPAYDIAAYWARSGLAAALTPPGAPLPFQRGGMGDHSVGMTAAGMVSAALVSRAEPARANLSRRHCSARALTRSASTSISPSCGAVRSRSGLGKPWAIRPSITTGRATAASSGSLAWRVNDTGRRSRCRRPSGVARRRPLRDPCGTFSQRAGTHCGARRGVRDEVAGRVGRDLRNRTRLLLVAGQHRRRPAR